MGGCSYDASLLERLSSRLLGESPDDDCMILKEVPRLIEKNKG